MNDTLKAAGRIGAELGAAKAENEKLRGLLHGAHDTIRNLAEDLDEEEFQVTIDQLAEIELALAPQQAEPKCSTCNDVGIIGHSDVCPDCADTWTQQAEPTDTYTAVDMATAAAQGFRDGQAAVEQAAAQDEQSPEQMLSREQIENIARKVHGDCIRLPGATYQHAAEAAVMYTLERIARPAQAEQPEQSGLVEALRTEALGLCDVVEKINSLSPVTYALQAGRAINKVRDAAAALSAQWTAEQ